MTTLETIPEDSGSVMETKIVNGYKVKDWGQIMRQQAQKARLSTRQEVQDMKKKRLTYKDRKTIQLKR